MLAYAPERRAVGAGQNSRRTLVVVAVGHVALVAVALTTKMTIDIVKREDPIVVESIKERDPPPPEPTPQADPAQPIQRVSHIDTTKPIIPIDKPLGPGVDIGPTGPTDPVLGTVLDPAPPIAIDPPRKPIKVGAALRTAEAELRPPYPTDKLRAEEEATLRLKLTIDEKGRVIAVDPVGAADPSFLAAARRHLLRSWRYKPATVDGVPTATTMVINLSFRLEDV